MFFSPAAITVIRWGWVIDETERQSKQYQSIIFYCCFLTFRAFMEISKEIFDIYLFVDMEDKFGL